MFVVFQAAFTAVLSVMLVIGLTGGIGSGKSTVAELFAKLGVDIIDTDAIAHQLTATGELALTTIANLFGQGMLATDGSLNRVKLRHLVFADTSAKKQLEDLLHPLIREQVVQKLAQTTIAPYRMVVVPLLFETGAYQHIVQRSLVVDCPEALQIQRALTRKTINEAEIRAVIAAQCTREQRLAAADDVLANDGDYEILIDKVENLHKKYLALA